VLDVVKALAALDPSGGGLDGACAQLEGRTYVMRTKLDLISALTGRTDTRIVKISRMPSGIPPQSRQTRSAEADALRATLQAPLIRSIAHGTRSARSIPSHALRCRRHATSTLTVIRAPASGRRASSALHRTTNVCNELAEAHMEYVEHPNTRPKLISIARCRELLGEDAESMTDQDIEDIRRHAEMMACIVVEMYQEQRRCSE
jgi:hypothetical protein